MLLIVLCSNKQLFAKIKFKKVKVYCIRTVGVFLPPIGEKCLIAALK